MDVELINAILDAAGPRRDAVMAVLFEHGILSRPNQDDPEPSGPDTEAEAPSEAVEDTEAEAEVSTEATEP